jgi:hypothetical protein
MKIIPIKFAYFIWFTFLFSGCISCDSFVEVDLPKSQLTNVTVFEDNATATAALTDIYAKIRDKGLLTGLSVGLSNQLGNYSDELIGYSSPSTATYNFYHNILFATNSTVADYWNVTYNQIYAANSVIEGAENSKGLTIENKKQLQGEAYFIRALLHFYLVNLFGDIPYISQTDYSVNKKVSRMPIKKVYENIVSDLQKSVEYLPETYTTIQRVRPNKLTARALLSRVYLYNRSFAEAANEASALINNASTFSLTQKIDEVFLIGSKETIWQLQSAIAGQNTREGATFILTSTPPSLTSLSPLLFSSFDVTDLRKYYWIKAVSKGTVTWYHPYKYKERLPTASSKEYSIVFRLAEQFLIRAEARAEQKDLIGAKEDLNKIRQRAGLSVTTAESKEEILSAILQERKWEFFTEFGHRFFDLKRSDKIDVVLSPVKSGWNLTDRLFPIPQIERNVNPNLGAQNAGY